MENVTEAALQWSVPGTAIWIAVMATVLAIASVWAHALGMARGRRMERLLGATRSSLEAAVHGVPDRRRGGLAVAPGQPGMLHGAKIPGCSTVSTRGLLSSQHLV